MHFDVRGQGRKSTRDRTLINLFISPAIMASGISTIFLSSNSDKLDIRLNLLLQEKHTGNNSDIFNKEIVAIVDKLLEKKCLFNKQHRQILINCNQLHI